MPQQIAGLECYRYRMIDMHTLDCDRFIREDNPDTLVLAIFCDFKDRGDHEMVRGIIAV